MKISFREAIWISILSPIAGLRTRSSERTYIGNFISEWYRELKSYLPMFAHIISGILEGNRVDQSTNVCKPVIEIFKRTYQWMLSKDINGGRTDE